MANLALLTLKIASQQANSAADKTAGKLQKLDAQAVKTAVRFKELNRARLNTLRSQQSAKRMERHLKSLAQQAEKTRMAIRNFGFAMTAAFTVPIALLGRLGLKAAAEFEKARVAFGVFVGDMDKGKKVFQDLVKFSAATPLDLSSLQRSAQILLATGTEADNLIDTLRMLGNAARGDGQILQRLALNLGQVRAQGKLTGRELRDFAVAGIPLTQELARMYGVTAGEIQKIVSKGDVGFKSVLDAFRRMTGEGGKFDNLLGKMSQTLGGKWTTAVDNAKIALASMVEPMIPTLNKMLDIFIGMSKVVTDLSPVTKSLLTILLGFAAIVGPLALIAAGFMKMKTIVIALIPLVGTLTARLKAMSAAAAVGFKALLAFEAGRFVGGKISDAFQTPFDAEGFAVAAGAVIDKLNKSTNTLATNFKKVGSAIKGVTDRAAELAKEQDKVIRQDMDRLFEDAELGRLPQSNEARLIEQITRQKLLNAGLERTVFITDKITEATKKAAMEGKRLSDEEATTIGNLAGELFDLRKKVEAPDLVPKVEELPGVVDVPSRAAEALEAGSREAFALMTSRETGKEARRDRTMKQNKDANTATAVAIASIERKGVKTDARVINSFEALG